MIFVVTGASGLVGRNTIHALLKGGHEVRALVRKPEQFLDLPAKNIFAWNDSQKAPAEVFKNTDAVIHLAGENVSDGRWTKERKERIESSRVIGTRHILQAIAELSEKERPKVFVAAAGIGYYGLHVENESVESDSVGEDFLAQVCLKWEKEIFTAEALKLRTVCMRFGLILSADGGLLSKMGPEILGNGKQWMSWIHIEDVVGFIQQAAEKPEIKGVFNLVAPNPVTQKELAQQLILQLGYPTSFPVPKLALQLALGELSEIVLASQKVKPKALIDIKFKFRYSYLAEALKDIYHGRHYLDGRLKVAQFVPHKRHEVFSFFAKAENLEQLTPPWLQFHVEKKSSEEIKKGSLIEYRLKIRGVPVKWKTLISQWSPEQSFVDEQLSGPYKKWHHTHEFFEVRGGTLLTDVIIFRVPGHIFGKTLLSSWVRNDVQTIFSYRQKVIAQLYK